MERKGRREGERGRRRDEESNRLKWRAASSPEMDGSRKLRVKRWIANRKAKEKINGGMNE